MSLQGGSQPAIKLNYGLLNADTQISGTGDAYLLYADASTDRIGIGTNAPASKLQVFDGAITMNEISSPSAPAADNGIIYLDDNGSGKTRLMIRFSSGAAQQLAIEP